MKIKVLITFMLIAVNAPTPELLDAKEHMDAQANVLQESMQELNQAMPVDAVPLNPPAFMALRTACDKTSAARANTQTRVAQVRQLVDHEIAQAEGDEVELGQLNVIDANIAHTIETMQQATEAIEAAQAIIQAQAPPRLAVRRETMLPPPPNQAPANPEPAQQQEDQQ